MARPVHGDVHAHRRVLIADGFGHHVPKGYIYFAMAFSVGVEMLNIRLRKKTVKPVELREPYVREVQETN